MNQLTAWWFFTAILFFADAVVELIFNISGFGFLGCGFIAYVIVWCMECEVRKG